MTLPRSWRGYGTWPTRLTDFRKKETVVCFACHGPVYLVQRVLHSTFECLKCKREIRSVEIVQTKRCEP